jgi:sulfotransferase
MVENIYFNSSLPRSGSTLLQNILGQNKDFFVSATSGVLELLHGARHNFTLAPEFKAQDISLCSKAFVEFCHSGLFGYYKALTDKKNIVDKSRGWIYYHNFLKTIYPGAKIICMVRDLREILSSYEKIERSNPLLLNNLTDEKNFKGINIQQRTLERLNKAPVGLAIQRLRNLLEIGDLKGVLFIRYEDLCLNPKETLNKIYNHIEEPEFDHNFLDIKQITFEDDDVYGIRNLHTIKSQLKFKPNSYNEILGEEVSQIIYNNFRWFFEFFNYGL